MQDYVFAAQQSNSADAFAMHVLIKWYEKFLPPIFPFFISQAFIGQHLGITHC